MVALGEAAKKVLVAGFPKAINELMKDDHKGFNISMNRRNIDRVIESKICDSSTRWMNQ